MTYDEGNWRDHHDELFDRVVKGGRARKRRRGFVVGATLLTLVLALASGLYLPGHNSHTLHVAKNVDNTTTTAAPARDSRVLLIGDSVMHLAKPALEQAIPEAQVDTASARQLGDTIPTLDAAKQHGALPSTIVIHLGDNGPSEGNVFDKITREFKTIMDTVGSGSEVYFLTLKLPRQWESAVNSALYSEAAVFPNAHVLAWHDFSQAHGDWFFVDGFHLSETGKTAYAAFIRDGIRRPPNDRDADSAIAYAFGHFFDPALTADQRAALIQDSAAMRASIDHSFAVHAAEAAAGEIIVDRVTVRGTTADVSFHALYQGHESPANPGQIDGTAVLEAGTWKISRTTYCTLSANDGEHCPPA